MTGHYLHTFILALVLISGQNCTRAQKLKISAATVFEFNDMNWDIAGDIDGKNPNVLSELVFKKRLNTGIGIKAAYSPFKNLQLTASYKHLRSIGGKGTDIDYTSDNRNGATDVLYFDSRNGKVSDLKFEGLFRLFSNRNMSLHAGVGLFLYRQLYGIRSGENKELNSSYDYRSKGTGFVLANSFKIPYKMDIRLYAAVNKVFYYGAGNWNLIEVFEKPKSFVHRSQGVNYGSGIELSKKLGRQLKIVAGYSILFEKTSNGTDTAFLRNNSRPVTRFNNSSLKRCYADLGLVYIFGWPKYRNGE